MDSVVPYLCNFFWYSLHFPRRQVWRTVIGTTVRRGSSFQNTSTLGIWVLDHFSELHGEPAGRTVIATTDRHKLRNPTLCLTCPSSFQQLHYAASYGPSQERRTVISSVGGLFCISLLKISAFSFEQISCKTKRNLNKNKHKKAFGHTKLKEKVLILPWNHGISTPST